MAKIGKIYNKTTLGVRNQNSWDIIKDMSPKELVEKGYKVRGIGRVHYNRLVTKLCVDGYYDRRNPKHFGNR